MLGQVLFNLRNSKGWSLSDLASRTGISSVNLHRYEKGTKPKREALELIAKAFNTTPEELIKKGNVTEEIIDPGRNQKLMQMLDLVKTYTPRERNAVYEFLQQINEKRDLLSKISALGRQEGKN